MPYIKENAREEAEVEGPFEAGDLAYILWLDILHWLDHGQPDSVAKLKGKNDGWDYSNMAHVIGVLETVKLEFVRTRLALYEDAKKAENGDVRKPKTKRYAHDKTE